MDDNMDANAQDGELSVRIELGLTTDSDLTMLDLYKRCRERVALVVSGRAELQHLTGEDLLWRSRIQTVEGQYRLNVPLAPLAQANLFGHPTRRARIAALRVADEANAQVVEQTIAGIQANADMVGDVANILSTSADPRSELLDLSKRKGIDTKFIRRFLRWRQESFLATVESTSIPFERPEIRRSQRVGDGVQLAVKLLKTDRPVLVERCDVEAASGGTGGAGVSAGATRELRFAEVDGWPRVALTAAREFGWLVQVNAFERIGTCSLNFLPADATDVLNLEELLSRMSTQLQTLTRVSERTSASDGGALDDFAEATGTGGA